MLRFLSREVYKRISSTDHRHELVYKGVRFLSTVSGDGGHGGGAAAAASGCRLAGKVALITGGASGLGKATAQEFIRQGAHVFIADIDTKLGRQTAQDLGSNTHFIHCDVTDDNQVSQAVDTAITHHGKLDIMYNNAGITGPLYPPNISDLDLNQFDHVMKVNVRGTLSGIKHASRVMIPMGSGSILCTASISGILGGLGPYPYSISKFAIPGIVKSVANELCKHGVRINCISPSLIPTPMVMEHFGMIYRNVGKEKLMEIINGSGVMKGSKCEDIDVAKAAVYLGSDEAKYISGHNLVVDGGFTSIKDLDLPSFDHVV